MEIRQRHPLIGTEVNGISLGAQLSQDEFDGLHQLWMAHPLLIFPKQDLSDAAQVQFARSFGEVEIHPSIAHRSSAYPEIYRVSNVTESGELMPSESDEWKYMELTWIWHSDSSFREIPSDGSILHGIEVPPEGGNTLFCNLYAVWDALDEDRQASLRDLEVVHSHDYILTHTKGLKEKRSEHYVDLPPVTQPMVRVHPVTGRESLFISPHTMSHVVDWSENESNALFAELTAFATQDQFVYRHKWQPDDVIMWDNRCTMHAVTPFESTRYRRIMHRATIAGSQPVIRAQEQVNA